jgi:CheY-like chemotaxis protein
MKDTTSVLLLDDNPDLVELHEAQIEQANSRFRVTAETDGRRARALAERQLFEFLVIDAKLNYKGVEFGGLRLADDLHARYGTNSILVISRFITAELMHDRGAYYDFIAKGGEERGSVFGAVLLGRLQQMRERQYVFVAMPFDKKFRQVYQRIKEGVTDCGLSCIRADEVVHTRAVYEGMLELVRKSKLVVFVADGGNCNAYYEAGFADAMHKEVFIVASSLDELKFDVRHRHTLIYGTKPASLRGELKKKLLALRHSAPVVL